MGIKCDDYPARQDHDLGGALTTAHPDTIETRRLWLEGQSRTASIEVNQAKVLDLRA